MDDVSYFGRSLYYDRAGVPIDYMLRALLNMFARAYVRVAATRVLSATDPTSTFRVSTVWIGMDYSWGIGPPVIFETMVFAGDGLGEFDCTRYATEAAARTGHRETVTVVAATLDNAIVLDEEPPIAIDGRGADDVNEQPEPETYTEWRLTGQPNGGFAPYDFTARDDDHVAGLRMIWGKIQSGEYPWKDATFTSRQVTISRTPWADVQFDDADTADSAECTRPGVEGS